ncbi:MAG TPA: ABC transporter ATP-binding protein [Thermoanaerobaculia bacterium]|jgi:putative ABC transport system ATP-binding protein
MSSQSLIELNRLEKSFLTEKVETRALHQLSLSVDPGEYVCITGPSGCGKSTLLSILGLLDTPTGGQYILNGQDVSSLSRDQRAKIRNKEIGFVFQSFNLISELTVEENVCLPLTYRKGMAQKDIKERAKAMLDKVEMSHRLSHFPSQLSGGQQQRVAIARSLINDPVVILADEPTGNLDSKNADIVLRLLRQLHEEGSTIVMVTHDPRSIEQKSRQIEMLDGQVVADEYQRLAQVGS